MAPAQQPVVHGPQLWLTQTWPWHVSLRKPQSWQRAPVAPHCEVLVPPTHVPPWQHPGQLVGLQAPWPTHRWLSHVPPSMTQFEQAWPPVPHAMGSSPPMHVLPWQHPAQLCASHDEPPVHVRFVQVAPPVQVWQGWPPVPHASSWSPCMQTSPWQHPLPQPLQPDVAAHMPPPAEATHVSPGVLQSAHACPPWPQAVAAVPVSHAPLVEQQPAHDAGLHW